MILIKKIDFKTIYFFYLSYNKLVIKLNISLSELRPDYNIIDIRDNYSYDIDHVFNAINIPMDELLRNYMFYLNKEDRYYIYCKSGVRSKKTCDLLRILGYNVVNVIDGFGK